MAQICEPSSNEVPCNFSVILMRLLLSEFKIKHFKQIKIEHTKERTGRGKEFTSA